GSIGSKHLTFTPRVREALALHQAAALHAMIDISDGLGADLHHICQESGCGAVLREQAIPIAEAAMQMHDSNSPLEHALGDGEDFELLFAVAPDEGQMLTKGHPLREQGILLAHIGECVDNGVWLETASGVRRPLPPAGYVHEFS